MTRLLLSEAVSRERAGTLRRWAVPQSSILSVGPSQVIKILFPELVSVVKNMKRCSKTVAIRGLQTEIMRLK